MVVIFIQPFFGKRNAVRPDDVGATVAPFAWACVCINECDSGIHLVTVRKGLREVGIEGLTVIVRSLRMRRVGHISRKVPCDAAEFRDKEPWSQ